MSLRVGSLGALLSPSACAWVVNGPTQTVVVASEPSSAMLTVDGVHTDP